MDEVERLAEAIKAGRTEDAAALLAEDPSLVDGRNLDGVSYLLLAMYYRRGEIVQLLRRRRQRLDVFESAALGDLNALTAALRENSELVNAYSRDGFTPLGLAAFFGRSEMVRALVRLGARVNAPSRNSFKVAPLHSAVASRDVESVRALLEAGADTAARQQKAVTALHGAAMNGDATIVDLLLAHGADASAVMEGGSTALELARKGNHEGVIRLINAHAEGRS